MMTFLGAAVAFFRTVPAVLQLQIALTLGGTGLADICTDIAQQQSIFATHGEQLCRGGAEQGALAVQGDA